MKALILAAGRGNRLRPLTDTLPKPLILVRGKPLIVHHIEKLATLGIKEIIINLHYLGDVIQKALGDGKQWGINIQYSPEDQPLEMVGGIVHALPLLGADPFLVISADIFTSYPLEELILKTPLNAHLVLVTNPRDHGQGDFSLSNQGQIILPTQATYTFGGIGLYQPHLFKNLSPAPLTLGQFLLPHLSHLWIEGEYYQGAWHNVGTMEELAQVQA